MAQQKPFRLTLAQRLCRPLPPLIAQRLRTVIYSQNRAFEDDFEFEVNAQTGSRFRHRTSDFHAYPFSVYGYYDWRNWAVALAICSPGDHIIEIGANIGTETIGFADIVGKTGRVSAFEPLPDNYGTIRRNAIHLEQLTVYPLAVGAACETIEFALPPDKHASGVGYVIQGSDTNSVPKIEIQSVSLDSLQQELGPSRLLVMDVEGSEILVLRGAREYLNRFQPAMVLEAASRHLKRAGYDLPTLYNELTMLHYQTYRIDRFGISKVDLGDHRHANWFCVHENETDLADSVARMVRQCGFLPCFLGLNPMMQLKSMR